MPSKIRHLHQGSRGRYHAKMGVPKNLHQIIGKRELIKALGGDRQVALRALPCGHSELPGHIGRRTARVKVKDHAEFPGTGNFTTLGGRNCHDTF